MATLEITIPDPLFPRVLDAFGGTYGELPADATEAYATLRLAIYIRDVLRAYEITTASTDAAETAEAAVGDLSGIS